MSYDIPYVCSCLCVGFFLCYTIMDIHWYDIEVACEERKQRSFVNFPANDKPQRVTTLGSQARWPVTKDSPCQSAHKDEGTKVGILHKEWPWPPAQWWLGPPHLPKASYFQFSTRKHPCSFSKIWCDFFFLRCIPTSLCDSKCNGRMPRAFCSSVLELSS